MGSLIKPLFVFSLSLLFWSPHTIFAATCANPSFRESGTYQIQKETREVLSNDLSGDGKPDLLAVNRESNSISVLINDGTGSFSATNYTVGSSPFGAAVGDFNNDGNPDIAVANNSSGDVSVLMGTGGGAFTAATSFAAATGPRDVVIADFNQDGRRDIAVANQQIGSISLLRGNGSGGFSAPTTTPILAAPVFMTTGDFNNDQRPDILVSTSSGTMMFLNNGTGSFSNSCSTAPSDAHAVADFNNDGKLDWVSGAALSADISVALGNGSGCVASTSTFPASNLSGVKAAFIAPGDLNNDGNVDLLVSLSSDGLTILLGNGSGGFGVPTKFGHAGMGPVAIADFDQDGNQDAVIATPFQAVTVMFGDGAGRFSLAMPRETYGVTAGDFNRDGKMDLAATDVLGVLVFLGTANGRFGSPTSFPTGNGAIGVANGDFNRDGKLDLVVAAQNPSRVTVILGDGSGSFGPPTNFTVDSQAWTVRVSDFNNDGKADLVTSHQGLSSVGILLGDGMGGFAPVVNYATAPDSNPQSTAAADFNRDGNTDLATPGFGTPILLGNGQGQFAAPYLATPNIPSTSLAVADFNLDGKIDIVSANPNFNVTNITVVLGDGNGNFGPPQILTVGGIAQSVIAADFNGDGIADVASANAVLNNAGPSNVTVLLNDGNGQFGAGVNFLVGVGPHAIIAPDVNGDGKPDLVTANGLGNLSLLTNTCQAEFLNALDHPRFFILQHYLDFLARDPDQGGWDYWTGQITECGTNQLCIHHRRIVVSAAFFVELEFQRTGYVVYRMHRAAFGTWPGTTTRANLTAAQFMADRQLLPEGADLAQSTINFANAFVQRPAFLQIYPTSQTNAQFVNLLFDKANLTPFTTERQQQIDAMNNSGKTRAQVLLDVIEISQFKTREYNRSFVLMQYFGYLRRDPDQGGYDFWLNIIDNHLQNNYRSMVCGFITSAEYQQRFGSAITRTNADCAQ